MNTQERVRPQTGHGRPVMRRNGQTTGPLSTRAGLTTHAIASAAAPAAASPIVAAEPDCRRLGAERRSAKRTAIGVGDLAHRDEDEVDDPPHAESAAGDQLEHAQPDLAEVEAVDAEVAEEGRQQEGDQPLLVGEDAGDVLGLVVVAAGRIADELVVLQLAGDGHRLEVGPAVRAVVLPERVHVEALGHARRRLLVPVLLLVGRRLRALRLRRRLLRRLVGLLRLLWLLWWG